MSVSKKYAMYVGRFQPFHEGHQWLIAQKLNVSVPVLVAVRNCPLDEANPQPASEVKKTIESFYRDQDVLVIIIPDIESINYGRGVGYSVNKFTPPTEIAEISATKIREGDRVILKNDTP